MLVVTAADAAAVTVDVVDVVDVDVVATPLHFVIQYNRLCSFLGEVGSLLPSYILCIVAGSRPVNDIWECLFSEPTNSSQLVSLTRKHIIQFCCLKIMDMNFKISQNECLMFVTKFKGGDTKSVPQQTKCFYLHLFHSFIVVVAICGICGES